MCSAPKSFAATLSRCWLNDQLIVVNERHGALETRGIAAVNYYSPHLIGARGWFSLILLSG
jgi:hypothetical protein